MRQGREIDMENATILFVDDEKDMLIIMEDLLEARGYSVITANNGVDGLSLAKSRKPDLIILDISMPDIDGGQVAQELKQSPETKDIPVIFLTGLLSKEDENTRHMVGGHIMFAKPCDFDALTKQIEKLLPIPAA